MTGRAGRWNLDVRPRAQRQLARLPEKIATAAAEFLTTSAIRCRMSMPGSIPSAADLAGAFATGWMKTLVPSRVRRLLVRAPDLGQESRYVVQVPAQPVQRQRVLVDRPASPLRVPCGVLVA